MGEITPDEARAIKDLAGLIPLYVAKPVKFEPGTKWVYCQSGINTAARIVEVVSGVPFDRFVERRLFGPLGMKDTTFYLSEEQLPRLATSYRRTDKGELEATKISILYGKAPTSRDRFPAANGGLFSTAPDYARFCRMILNGGELDGQALPEAGVDRADDDGPDRRPEDRLHPRQWLGPGLVRHPRAAGSDRHALARYLRPRRGVRDPGVDRPREEADLPLDDPAGGLPELRCVRRPSGVPGGGEFRLGSREMSGSRRSSG